MHTISRLRFFLHHAAVFSLIFLCLHTVVCLQSISSKSRRKVLETMSKSVLTISSASTILVGDPIVGYSLTPKEAEIAYDSYAANYDELDGGKAADIFGLDEARSALFRQARGSVLEIGVGTGLNLEKYDPSKLESLTLVDISRGMLGEAQKRFEAIPALQRVPVRFIQADATSGLTVRFGDGSFDTVVDSFSFCVMGSKGAQSCLEQVKNVVKSKENNGQILLLENTRSSNPLLGLYQDATAEAAASAGGKGCLYNQDVSKMIQATNGIEIMKETSFAGGVFRSYFCQVVT
ncbi:unnamed protein product [Pseudo-nitzschia multistriata]|uniref:Methyltransferase domain-containing protein n=1 Tax=Pseudo-nitzschia multistriata TaxID=183589 RepID=A0A448ZHS4_9STRA|nr:unnamed protein product [Pseudo-nitzschia multistriata]